MSATEKTYEMFWDCRFCGQRKSLGLSHRHCPGCGAPQDPGARYFPSDTEKVAVEDHPYVGADVTCPACNFANSRQSRCCASCGSPLTAARTVALRDDAPVGGPHGMAPPGMGPPGMAPPGVAQPKKKGFPMALVLVPIALVLLGFGGCLFVALEQRPGELEVRGRSWQRTIEVEKNTIERVTTWCDSVPKGSPVVSKTSAKRGTEKIPDGESCTTRRKDQGNGTFKEVKDCKPRYKEKPVYDDECVYETPRWRTVRTERAEGTAADVPRWPDAALARPGACLGCEREGKRTESYLLKLHEPKTGEDGECAVPEAAWASYALGDRCKASVGAVLGNIDCSSLTKK